MLKKKIKSIEFRIFDPKTIRKMSVIDIKTPETYDKDGFPIEEGLMDQHLGVINPGLRCKTDGQTMKNCPGYFGSFELVRPVIHPGFGKKIEDIMIMTDKDTGKFIVGEEEVQKLRTKAGTNEDFLKKLRLKSIKHKNANKVMLDRPTNFYMGDERIYPTQIREWLEKISDKDLVTLGINPEILRPEWLVLTVLPVPPITIRPSITLDNGIKSEDDLTHKLVDIIRINQRLKDNIDAGAPQLIIEDLWDLLQYHITTYMDNQVAGVPPAKHRSGRPLRTISQRLKGKKGRFRHNLTGKRVNFAARTTVSPDPFLSINQVGVPRLIADELTVREPFTEWNRKKIENLIKDGRVRSITRPDGMRQRITEENQELILEALDLGYYVERNLENGDIVLFNRQPSLHRLSMLAHKVWIHDEKTLKLNPIVATPYNADFDGDEMNLHVPQTEEGRAEAEELMMVQKQIISPRYGAPIIIMDEDGISGSFALTMDSSEFTQEEAYKYFYEIGITEPPKPDRAGGKYSGKLIFSQLLPKNLNLEYETKIAKIIKKMHSGKDVEKILKDNGGYVKIKNGQLIEGVIDANSLGEGKGKLVDELARNYPPEILERFYFHLSRINSELLTKKGMTVGLDDGKVSQEVIKKRDQVIKRAEKESAEIVESYKTKKMDLIPGRSLEESFEARMMRLSFEVKADLEKTILQEKMEDVFGLRKKLGSAVMIASGARGSETNLMNISGFWGQASVREGRPKRGFTNRILSVNKPHEVGLYDYGFITHNFMEGMNPTEYFFHSIGGRQGEVDTGVSTKVSGYLYRRLANSLKDLSVENDSSVRTGGKKIVQFKYGEDGIFPMKSKFGKAVDFEKELRDAKKKAKVK